MSLHTAIIYDPTTEDSARMRRDGICWDLAGGAEHAVLGTGAPDWFAMQHDPRASRVKAGHSREVWKVSLSSVAVYAKVWLKPTGYDRLRRWLAGDPSWREWRLTREAAARGVPVVKPLAVGVLNPRKRTTASLPRRGIHSVFLSEAFDQADTFLHTWLSLAREGSFVDQRLARDTLIQAAARLFALAHEAGFAHGDAHPDNILARSTADQGWELRFADVQKARFYRGPLSMRASLSSIAQFDQALRRVAGRSDRLRFFRHYTVARSAEWCFPDVTGVRHADGPRPGERELLARFDEVSASHDESLIRHRDRRLRRKGKYFCTLDLSGGWRATVVLKSARRHIFSETGQPDRSESEWREIFDKVLGDVGRNGADVGTLVVDSFDVACCEPRSLIATLFGSPDRRRFEDCHKRRHRDEHSELILAYAEHRSAGFIDKTLLVLPRSGPV